jgi:hypothetical protein
MAMAWVEEGSVVRGQNKIKETIDRGSCQNWLNSQGAKHPKSRQLTC